jgi:hypothetical protein
VTWSVPSRTSAGLSVGALLLSLACSSTGPTAPKKPTFPAKGKVLVDGKGVAGAVVTLHPLDQAGSPPTPVYGRSDSEGVFVLSTYGKDDGAPAGRYAVTVLLQQGEEGVTLLPLHYADPKKSGLSAEIKPEPNELPPFKLKRR